MIRLAVLLGIGVVIVMFVRKTLKRGQALREEEDKQRLAQDELQKTSRLLSEFAKESDVLTNKLRNAEEISPTAAKHYEYTYNTLMPLLWTHRGILLSHFRQIRQEEGDYSEAPDLVKECEVKYKRITEQIRGARAGLHKEAQAVDAIFEAFNFEVETFSKNVRAGVGTEKGLAQLRERAEALKAVLPLAAKYWDSDKVEKIREALAPIDEMTASLRESGEADKALEAIESEKAIDAHLAKVEKARTACKAKLEEHGNMSLKNVPTDALKLLQDYLWLLAEGGIMTAETIEVKDAIQKAKPLIINGTPESLQRAQEALSSAFAACSAAHDVLAPPGEAHAENGKTHHEILGISPTASVDEIKKAYREKAKRLHPDVMPDELKDAAEDKFKAIQAAYEALMGKTTAAGA